MKSGCNIINEYLVQYYALNVEKAYKYYNPNLMRNQGLIKDEQDTHCNFKTSVKMFVQNDKDLKKTINKNKDDLKNYKQYQQEKVRTKERQSKCTNFIIKFENIMINRHQDII